MTTEMTIDELDTRIRACAEMVRKLCDDLQAETPSVEKSIALGALLGCLRILGTLGGIVLINEADETGTRCVVCGETLTRDELEHGAGLCTAHIASVP